MLILTSSQVFGGKSGLPEAVDLVHIAEAYTGRLSDLDIMNSGRGAGGATVRRDPQPTGAAALFVRTDPPPDDTQARPVPEAWSETLPVEAAGEPAPTIPPSPSVTSRPMPLFGSETGWAPAAPSMTERAMWAPASML